MGDAAMSAERPQGSGDPLHSQAITEARSLLAPGNLLSQTVETQLLPAERFKGKQKGEVIDIKKIGEVVTTLTKEDDHYIAYFYDGRGNPTEVSLDPTSWDIANTTYQGTTFIRTKLNGSSSSDQLQDIISKFHFSPTDTQRLINTWTQGTWHKLGLNPDSDGEIRKDTILQKPPVAIPAGTWTISVKRHPQHGDLVMFDVNDSHFAVLPKPPYQKNSVPDSAVGEYSNPDLSLIDDLQLQVQETIFNITDKNGRVLANYSGFNPHTDPSDPNFLYFINTGKVYKIDLNGVADRSTTPRAEVQIKVDNPREMAFDPQGNFLVIRSGDDKVHIVDKEGGDIVRTFDGVNGPILVDDQGDIIFVDTSGNLREIQTNFQAIPKGGSEVARQRRDEELRQIQERFANLELGKIQRQKGEGITKSDVAQTLRESISRQVTEPLTQATKPEEIEDLLDRLQGLKADPAYQAYGEVVDEFIEQARGKLSGIRVAELDTQLGTYQKALDDVKTVGDTIGLDEQFAKLLDLRQKIDITDPQRRREIEQQLRGLQARKDGINNQYQGELLKAIDETLPQIAQLVKETGSPQELAYFSSSTQAQQFEMMLVNVKDPQARRELRERYNGMRSEQRGKLEERSNQLAEQDRLRWAQVVEEAREDLGSLQEQITALSDAREIDRFDRNPLVTAWRAKLFALPPELRAIEEKRLEIILGARKKDMEHRKELGAVGEAGELKFGNAIFPIYKEPPRIWQPRFVPIKGGLDFADLVFEDTQGRVWRPDGDQRTVVTPDMSDKRTQRVIERYKKQADEYFKGLKRKVPEFDEHWRITDYLMEKLEEVAEALNLQLDNHRGILILQGEAGTGKNVLVDMLSNLSNRIVITVACNENSVKEDLTYEFYYEPGKGTYKLPSKLIEGIQTPGAVILFDEINALRPGIAKMLNALFDYRRRIFQSEGGGEKEIIVDPTVLFVGTMNPQNYAGVNRLSPEVKSRSRVIDIDYPPFEMQQGGRTRYRSDEAEMLAGYMDDLSELKQREFKQVWDYVINRDTTNGADQIVQGNPQLETDVRRIYDVIRVANKLRDMYTAYQIGDSNEPMDFPTSLREVTDIVMEMNHRQGVKPMIKRVIIPKIDDRRQKRLVDDTIEAVLPNP